MTIASVAEMVAVAKAEITVLSMEEVLRATVEDRALLVDLREAEELIQAGRIPGAIHVPRGMLEFRADPASPWHDPRLATDRTLILFCAAAWRSALAVKTLRDMGIDDVAEMAGGFQTWAAAGYPVEKETDPQPSR
ncbi:rhodanese-like domain-containing protein [Palleronia sp. LCG004]|uniref:rhodanese-like domain-containing protein n=1 Tax=Palleronia sp. LCG004 TaxID=3079304 RepID=UPI0029434157|nr:rhodanese-like domain-containing protein [Palleronia sp. LCG004]WOI56354.1 rhodanese-like domain-containing protein [Palleronia sp. LCG004]